MCFYNSSIQGTAPSLVLLVLGDEGSTIHFHFDVDTDRAGLSGIYLCSRIVENSVTILGSQAVCYWESDSILAARFSRDASAEISQPISLIPGLIANKEDPSLVQTDPTLLTKELSAPANPRAPAPIIESNKVINACDLLVLDGSNSNGSGGRAWIGGWVWDVLPPEDGSSDRIALLSTFLATQNSPTVNIDATALKLNTTLTYIFSLTLTNWLNLTSTALFPVLLPIQMLSLSSLSLS